jgi:hypothetical protein
MGGRVRWTVGAAGRLALELGLAFIRFLRFMSLHFVRASRKESLARDAEGLGGGNGDGDGDGAFFARGRGSLRQATTMSPAPLRRSKKKAAVIAM